MCIPYKRSRPILLVLGARLYCKLFRQGNLFFRSRRSPSESSQAPPTRSVRSLGRHPSAKHSRGSISATSGVSSLRVVRRVILHRCMRDASPALPLDINSREVSLFKTSRCRKKCSSISGSSIARASFLSPVRQEKVSPGCQSQGRGSPTAHPTDTVRRDNESSCRQASPPSEIALDSVASTLRCVRIVNLFYRPSTN